MKKLILFIALLSFVLSGFSQSTMRTRDNTNVNGNKYAFSASTSLHDSIGVSQDSVAFPIEISYPDSVFAYYKTVLTEITSPAVVIVQYQVKRFNTDSWIIAATSTYYGTGADTTILFKSVAPYQSCNHQRILYIYSSNSAYPSELSGWFLK